MAATFKISGQHVEVTPALDSYARKKLTKIEEIFPNVMVNIHAMLIVEPKKRQQTAEANVIISGDQKPIYASATTNDMYKSIDELEKKLMAQANKYHGKLTDHHHHHRDESE